MLSHATPALLLAAGLPSCACRAPPHHAFTSHLPPCPACLPLPPGLAPFRWSHGIISTETRDGALDNCDFASIYPLTDVRFGCCPSLPHACAGERRTLGTLGCPIGGSLWTVKHVCWTRAALLHLPSRPLQPPVRRRRRGRTHTCLQLMLPCPPVRRPRWAVGLRSAMSL